LSFAEEQLSITINDDGKGIESPSSNGNGMVNMKRRIKRLNGTMEIINLKGVTIEFSIPLKQKLV